jgi:hypothetical protein
MKAGAVLGCKLGRLNGLGNRELWLDEMFECVSLRSIELFSLNLRMPNIPSPHKATVSPLILITVQSPFLFIPVQHCIGRFRRKRKRQPAARHRKHRGWKRPDMRASEQRIT